MNVTRQSYEYLDSIVTSQVKPFSLDGYSTLGKCVEVYDGDTCKVIFASPDNVNVYHRWTIRMLGYDTPEMKGEHRDLGVKARDALREKILNKIVYVVCGGSDKYGRILATIYQVDSNSLEISSESVNDFILHNTVGTYAYDGGKKQSIVVDDNV